MTKTLEQRFAKYEQGKGSDKWRAYFKELGDTTGNEVNLVRLHVRALEAKVLLDNAPESDFGVYALEMLQKALKLLPDFDPRWSSGETGEGRYIYTE